MTTLKNIGRSRLERIRDKMKQQRATKMPYSKIASFWGISKGTAFRIEKHGHEPTSNAIRKQLGLSEIITVHVYRDRKGRFSKGDDDVA